MSGRYGPAERLIDLILELGSSRVGLTLDDIQRKFQVSRSTAERLIKAAGQQVKLEERDDGDRRKRWRTSRVPAILAAPSAEDLAALTRAGTHLAGLGLEDDATRLLTLQTKLRSMLDAATARRIEPDLEALIEAEGFAARPGPRPRIDPEVLDELRYAIKARCRVRIDYRYRGSGKDGCQTVHPYGFLYGSRHYLIAYSENSRANEIRSFALGNIQAVTRLEGSFEPKDGFSIDDYAAGMFGVFREPPVRVVWRFSAGAAAADAREFRFHRDQEMRDLPDGRLEVTFEAGGLREMAWHLFTWGSQVEIVEPAELRQMMERMLRRALEAHGGQVECADLIDADEHSDGDASRQSYRAPQRSNCE